MHTTLIMENLTVCFRIEKFVKRFKIQGLFQPANRKAVLQPINERNINSTLRASANPNAGYCYRTHGKLPAQNFFWRERCCSPHKQIFKVWIKSLQWRDFIKSINNQASPNSTLNVVSFLGQKRDPDDAIVSTCRYNHTTACL